MKTSTKFLIFLFWLALLCRAQAPDAWYFNEFLFLEYWGDPAAYAAFVAGGAPCYAWVGAGAPDSPQPECFYDPSNLNRGYVAPLRRRR